MLKSRIFSAVLALTTGLAVTACEDEDLEREDVAGSYTATQLSITTGSDVIDVLEQGGEVTLVLGVDGRTAGTIDAPAIGEDPAFSADLEGTWDIQGELITLDHDADTFLRDMVFEFEAGQLVASELFIDGLIDITLTRTDQDS